MRVVSALFSVIAMVVGVALWLSFLRRQTRRSDPFVVDPNQFEADHPQSLPGVMNDPSQVGRARIASRRLRALDQLRDANDVGQLPPTRGDYSGD